MGTKISDLPVTGVLPADAVFPLEYSGANYSVKASDLGTGGSGGGSWSSGWVDTDGTTTVNNRQSLTFNHGLGTSDLNIEIYVADDAAGTNSVNLESHQSDDNLGLMYGAQAQDINSNSITVEFGAKYMVLNPTGSSGIAYSYGSFENKWIKVVVMSGGGSGTNEYTSEELDITKNTTISESHGLGAVPSLAKGELVCKVAEHGYVVGDVIELGNNWFSDGSPGSSQNNGVSITKSLTEISAVIGDEIQILETTNSTLGPNITIANWKLVLRGYIFSGGSSSSGTTSAILPFAHARIFTDNAGTGIGISWGAYNNGYVEVTFDTAQPDTDYYVVTDRETYDQHLIDIDQKTTSGFRTKWINSDNSLVSPGTFGGMLTVYGSTPTIDIGGGSSSSGPRAYVAFDGTATNLTASITKSFNVDSITDNGVGDYTANLTNAVTDPVPVVSLLYPTIAINPMDASFTVVSTTTIRILTGTNSSGLFDADGVYLVVF